MINHLPLPPLTVLIRTNREDSVNYLRINADLSRPDMVADAAADVFYSELLQGLFEIECDPGSAADAWRENGCEIVGIAEGHFNIATSGCDTVSCLCSYLQFAIDAEKPQRVEEPRSVAAVHAFAHAYGNGETKTANAFPFRYGDCKPFTCEHCGRVYHDGGECTYDDCPGRVALVSVFVGDDDNDPGYDTFLSVVAASHDTAAVIAAVKADYEASAGPGSWEGNGAFIVGMGEGVFRGTWDTNGLADSDIAAVCAGVLGGEK